jgi:hypothetical protein
MAQFDTVETVVADVATEFGLGSVTVSYASTDNNVLQLLGLLKKLGRRMVLRHPWLQNTKEYTFTTTTDTVYALPADFQSMVDQTGWDRDSNEPIYPASPQEWQCLKAHGTTNTISIIFRPGFASTTGAPQMELVTTPTAGVTVAFEYLSRYWVATSASTAVSKDAPTLTTDVIRIDSVLMSAALKVAFARAKGFDSSAALEEYLDILDGVRSANIGAAPILQIGRSVDDGLLSERNAPRQSFGLDGGGLFP